MATLLLIVLILLALVIMAEAIRNSARIYQYPFTASAVFLGFIIPPLCGLVRASYLPRWSFERYTLLCILCLAMCWLGDVCARRYSRPRARSVRYDSRRWLLGSAVLVLLGGLAYLKSRALFKAEFDMSTGLPTALSFFVSLLRYGFVMALLHFLYTGNRYSLYIACVAAAYYLDRTVLFGRRLHHRPERLVEPEGCERHRRVPQGNRRGKLGDSQWRLSDRHERRMQGV